MVVDLVADSYKYFCSVHRLVLETYVGSCPVGMQGRHLNDNKQDNKIKNLRWGTPQENMDDRMKIGHTAYGEKHGRAKLTERNVRMIIYMYRTGLFLQKEIAKIYKVDKTLISLIINKKSWRHLWAVI